MPIIIYLITLCLSVQDSRNIYRYLFFPRIILTFHILFCFALFSFVLISMQNHNKAQQSVNNVHLKIHIYGLVGHFCGCYQYIRYTVFRLSSITYCYLLKLLVLTDPICIVQRECYRFDESFVISCTGSCQNDNFQCMQSR